MFTDLARPSPTAANAPQPLALDRSWQWHVQSADVDAHARAQPGWQLEYQQLSGGRFHGRLHQVQLPGLRLIREDADRALRQQGALGPGDYAIALPLAASGPAIFNGQQVQGDGVMVGRGDVLDLVTPAQFSLIAAVVDAELLAPLWQSLYHKPPAAWLQWQLVVPGRPAAAVALRRLHLQALQTLASPAAQALSPTALLQMRDALLIEWLEVLPERVDPRDLPATTARKRLVDQACALMLDPGAEPLSMLDVCRRVGASRRKLNYCFQDVLGTSPLKYLRAVRLNQVRRALRTDAASVQAAATQAGFWHLGQFSRDYKQQFGELPSATLRGAAVRHSGRL